MTLFSMDSGVKRVFDSVNNKEICDEIELAKNKFKCPLGGYVDGHNCHALGCLHLINNECPIYKRMTNAEGGKE